MKEQARDSPVIKLTDVFSPSKEGPPTMFGTHFNQNEMDNWTQHRFADMKDLMAPVYREQNLNQRLKLGIKAFKKRLRQESADTKVYKRHLDKLNLEWDSSDVSSQKSWDIVEEMNIQRKKTGYYRYTADKLRAKLVRLGRVKSMSEADKLEIDSLMESAYNSEKKIEWGKREESFKAPVPSIESGERFALFDNLSNESSDIDAIPTHEVGRNLETPLSTSSKASLVTDN